MERCFDISSERNLISFEFLSRGNGFEIADSKIRRTRIVVDSWKKLWRSIVNRETIYPSEFFICYLFRDARNVPVSFIQQLLVRKRTAPEAAKTELGKESPLERDDRTIRVSYSAFARTSRDRSIYGAQRFDQTPFFLLLLLLLSSNVKESIVIERWIRSWVG